MLLPKEIVFVIVKFKTVIENFGGIFPAAEMGAIFDFLHTVSAVVKVQPQKAFILWGFFAYNRNHESAVLYQRRDYHFNIHTAYIPTLF